MQVSKSALGKYAEEYIYTPTSKLTDVESYLYKEGLKKIRSTVKYKISQLQNIKFQLSLQVELKRWKDNELLKIQPWFNSKVVSVIGKNSIRDLLLNVFEHIIQGYDTFLEHGSGWTFHQLLSLKLSVAKYQPLKGGCTSHKLPKVISRKHACLTVNCDNNKCFLYAVLAHLYPCKSHPEKPNNYEPFIDNLNLKNVQFPVNVKDISKFEALNQVSINVFGYSAVPYPIYVSKNIVDHESKHIDLLYFNKHYYLIKNLSRFIGSSFKQHSYKKFICRFCLSNYSSKQKLSQHMQYCLKKCQRYSMPSKGSHLSFTNHRAQFRSPFVIYYDFECLLKGDVPKNDKSKVVKEKVHVPIAFSAKRVCTEPKHNSNLYTYVGLDCLKVFVKFLQDQHSEIQRITFTEYNDIKWTKWNLRRFNNRKTCQICKSAFSSSNRKCADHDHLSGKYRMALCNRCNLTYASVPSKIPCIAHNCMNYDMQLLISELGRIAKNKKYQLKVIAKNKERFHAVYFHQYIFIDSFAFLPTSLSKLVNSLFTKGVDEFKHTKLYAGNNIDLFLRKGVFCYDFLDSVQKLTYPKLPRIEDFYDSLNDTKAKKEDYDHAKKVWETFKCTTLEQYMVKYLESDVLLLVDVFEAFRGMAYQSYNLEATKYLSLPHFGMDAALKMSNIKLELLTSIDMYNFISQGVRGGISSIMHRYAKANNPRLYDYHPNEPESYIMYFDCTNLYGYAMTQYLPFSNFHWLSEKEMSNLKIKSIPDKGCVGYILEVDLEYPECLHDLHNDYPVAPEKMSIPPDDWSPWMTKTASNLGIPSKKGPEKLILSVRDKHRYILHFRNLKLYLQLGLRLGKIHKVLAFDQKPWMDSFIQFNTEKRKQAKTSFEQDFWKLLCNSAYGKLLEDVRKRVDIRLVTDNKKFVTLTSKPNFHTFQIINKRLVAMQLMKTQILLNKPIYAGFAVLELSKVQMYSFHYKFIKSLYGENAVLLFTDTDSLCYIIYSKNIYNDIRNNLRYFDTSNYAKQSLLYSEQNKKKIGTFKDEYGGISPSAFVGLRSKMYALKTEEGCNTKKAKGLKKQITDNISFEDYVETLEASHLKKHNFCAIRSIKHTIYSTKERKTGLSPWDDKRFVLADGIKTLAFGHYSTKKA